MRHLEAKTAAQPVRDCTAKPKEWPLAWLKLWVFFLGLPPPASCSLYVMAEGPPVSQVKVLLMDYITTLHISAWTQTSLPKTNMFAASPAFRSIRFSCDTEAKYQSMLMWPIPKLPLILEWGLLTSPLYPLNPGRLSLEGKTTIN